MFFAVFAMVSFGTGQSKESLFEDRVFAIPERQRETESSLAIGDS